MLGHQTGLENGFPLAISDCKTIDRILERRMPFSSLYPSTSITSITCPKSYHKAIYKKQINKTKKKDVKSLHYYFVVNEKRSTASERSIASIGKHRRRRQHRARGKRIDRRRHRRSWCWWKRQRRRRWWSWGPGRRASIIRY